jgi:hypothetical protein
VCTDSLEYGIGTMHPNGHSLTDGIYQGQINFDRNDAGRFRR